MYYPVFARLPCSNPAKSGKYGEVRKKIGCPKKDTLDSPPRASTIPFFQDFSVTGTEQRES